MNKVVEKIKKLMALCESPNVHEAELAAEKMQELLMKHNLSMTDIHDQPEAVSELNVASKGRHETWCQLLIENLAKYNCAQVVYCHHFDTFTGKQTIQLTLIGRESTTAALKEMYTYLCTAIIRIANEMQIPRKDRSSYKLGMVCGLDDRLREKYTTIIESDEKGLILHEEANRKRENEHYMKSIGAVKAKQNLPSLNKSAFFNGCKASDRIGLDDQINTRTSKRTRIEEAV